MSVVLSVILNNPGILMRWGAVGAFSLAVVFAAYRLVGVESSDLSDRPAWVEVERAVSGHSIKLDTDERLNYAAIRAPYRQEPFYDEAKQRNAALVNDKKVRLRFDDIDRDRKGRLLAYVFVDGKMVNETLVREGLAYVRLTPNTRRYAERLLAAQAEARKAKRGLWSRASASDEHSYPADPKYGTFHRPSCADAGKIKSRRLITFDNKKKALDEGFAPCPKCLP